MASPSKTIAFIGATGGCANAALALSLHAGYTCSALARTPSKLTDKLLEAGVPQSAIDTHLHIVKGDIRDASALHSALRPQTAIVDIVVSGIGMRMGKNQDSNICRDATRCLLAAIDDLATPQKPVLAHISSTGISLGPRDVPIAMQPLYYVGLKTPHADKKAMEEETIKAGQEGKVGGWVFIRPSFLTDGKESGIGKIRVGTEEKPAIGYTISRLDVGRWIFEELIKGDIIKWKGQKPSITY